LKPVARALAAAGVVPRLIFTGQHRIEPCDFGLEGLARTMLDCPGRQDPHAHVRAVTIAIEGALDPPPNLLVVQGDTSSAMGTALAGFKRGIPVAHVEAGLRTHDQSLPWPEEEYRTAIDAGADLLFAPTETSAANLRAEKVAGAIMVTGNTAIDAVLDAIPSLPSPTLRDGGLPRLLITCHRRENWSGGLHSIADAVNELARDSRIGFVLHPNPFVAGEMRRHLSNSPGVQLLGPCGHHELLGLMRGADIVLSDSGGIQEEAPALGVPLLVLRDKTERPEGIAAGTTRLVGTDTARIVAEVRRLLDDPVERALMSRPTFPFGDGRAGKRIAAAIGDWLAQRPLTRRLG
jgi:UDP-N-acetylglucosamine 2-epimerase (non-hydrolysing)